MAWLSDLLIRIRADSADFVSDMGKASNAADKAFGQIKKAGAAVGLAFSGYQIAAFFKSAIDGADRLDELSKSTKISVENLAGLAVVAKQTGGDVEGAAAAINKLAMNMGKAPEKFKAIGVSAKDPMEAMLQFADVFNAIEDPQKRAAVAGTALGKTWQSIAPMLADGGARLRELIEEGKRINPITQEMAERAGAFNDKLDALKISASAVGITLVQDLLPPLTRIADEMLKAKQNSGVWAGFMAGLGRYLFEIFDGVDDPVQRAGREATELMDKLNRAQQEFEKLGGPKQLKLEANLDEAISPIKRAKAELDKFTEEYKKAAAFFNQQSANAEKEKTPPKAKVTPPSAAAIKKFTEGDAEQRLEESRQKRMAAAIQEMENKRKSLFDTTEEALMLERLYGNEIDVGDGKMRHFKGTYEDFDEVVKKWLQTGAREIDARKQLLMVHEMQMKYVEELAQRQEQENALTEQATRSIREQTAAMQFQNELIGRSAAEQERLTLAREQDLATQERIRARLSLMSDDPIGSGEAARIILEETKRGEDAKKRMEDLLKFRQEKEREWATGARKAHMDYLDSAQNAAEIANRFFTNAFQSMEDALVQFVKTGKLDFKSLADSIITDLIRIKIKKDVIGPLSKAMDEGDIFGGIGKMLGFGKSAAATSSGGGTVLSGLEAFGGFFATGGEPPLGIPSIVGEEGPEIFLPKQAGTIIPNGGFPSRMPAFNIPAVSGGGGGRSNTYVIDARNADNGVEARLTGLLMKLAGPGVVERRAIRATSEYRRR